MDDLTNQFIGGYHFQWKIASGGMATVYLGQRVDDPNAPQVALKVLHSELAANPVLRKRFQREADIGKRLRHPHIVEVYDLIDEDDYLFIVMQYLPGGSLTDRIVEFGPREWSEAITIIEQIGDALIFAHRQGVIHRDVKSSNILFDDDGQAYLTDFGVAHELDASTLTAAGFQPGTVAYMSPEQIQGKEVNAQSDLFSLAVMFQYILTGSLPFDATTATAVTYQIAHDPPKKLPKRQDIPNRAQQTLAKALAKEPQNRYESIEAFIEALKALHVGQGKKTLPWVWAGVLGLVLLALISGALILHPTMPWQKRTDNTTPPVQSTKTNVMAANNDAPSVASLPSDASPQPQTTSEKADSETSAPITAAPNTITPTPSPTPSPRASLPTLVPTNTPALAAVRSNNASKTSTPEEMTTAKAKAKQIAPAPDQALGAQQVLFKWQLSRGALASGQQFQVVFHRCDQNPLTKGFGAAPPTTALQIQINLMELDSTANLPFTAGEWCWDIAIGKGTGNSWRRIAIISSNPSHFVYQPDAAPPTLPPTNTPPPPPTVTPPPTDTPAPPPTDTPAPPPTDTPAPPPTNTPAPPPTDTPAPPPAA